MRIAVFGHYGNKNLGDEAITEAMIKRMRERLPNAEFIGMSINPEDTALRHQLESFPIRLRPDVPTRAIFPTENLGELSYNDSTTEKPNRRLPTQQRTGGVSKLKTIVRQVPLLGAVLRLPFQLKDFAAKIKNEIQFLKQANQYIQNIDLLAITGSNQFLDNFGGSWGFPYTLMKWTWLAKRHGKKVAFVSVGAGPLSRTLSFAMLRYTLNRADYLSYRDEGSKALVESRIKSIDGAIYPDVAHSLGVEQANSVESEAFTVAVNPMPVYDARYWPIADEQKYRDYIRKMIELIKLVLKENNQLTLFGTQLKDFSVVEDILEQLRQEENYNEWATNISVSKDPTVTQLMSTISSAHMVVATRFHATVLPFQVGKPVLGICYYRKASELLDDVGLNDYHVDIEDFSATDLCEKYLNLRANHAELSQQVLRNSKQYEVALDEQYDALARLAQ